MKRLPAFFLATLSVLAQDWRYELITPTNQAPPARIDGTISYVADNASIFLFGGSGGGFLNDLWNFNLNTKAWTRLEPSGTPPAARLGHTLLTDAKRNRLILFGGQARGFFSDVWAYNIATNNWQRLAADTAGPSNRYGHSAVLDSNTDRMIISHGFTNSGRFDDTWAFDLNTNRWTNITPSGTKPLRRCLHHAVLDPATRQMFLYGGCASGFGPCPLGDLWSFNLNTNTWTEVTPSSRPAARQHYGFSFDSRRNRIVLNGGSSLGDTWFYNPSNRIWNQLPTSIPGPSARDRHQGAYAAERGTNFFFGGDTNTGSSSELWALSSGLPNIPTIASNGIVNAFSGVGGAVAPGEYISVFGDSLSPEPTVSLNGTPVPVVFAGPTQINLQVPFNWTSQDLALQVSRASETSNELRLPVVAAKPGLFPTAVNQDNQLNSATNPASAGSIVVFYATGQGTNPSAVSLEIAGQPAELLFAATSPGAAGLMQINARVPQGLPSGPASVKLRIAESESQPGVQVFIR
jgi:uncharacterized protein (TIGR03437 family)